MEHMWSCVRMFDTSQKGVGEACACIDFLSLTPALLNARAKFDEGLSVDQFTPVTSSNYY